MLREKFPKTQIVALTATANQRIREDIVKHLRLANVKWVLGQFDRPNLNYTVLPKKNGTSDQIIALIKTKFPHDSGIIYCLSRNDCEVVADKLKNHQIEASAYHAGFKDTVRERIQKDWMNGRVKVVCATVAFGMGVDKANVRYVIHLNIPKSMDGYYQESGRAGRDNKVADCILYYSYADYIRIKSAVIGN